MSANRPARSSRTTHTSGWRSKIRSAYTTGELALAKTLQDAGIEYRTQVPVETRFHPWPFVVDFMIGRRLIVEVQGGLHYRTWGGRPAKNRMKKDAARKACLEAEGYKVLEFTDKDIKQRPGTVLAVIQNHLDRVDRQGRKILVRELAGHVSGAND